MRPPNSRHSDPRNSHIANLVLEMPGFVSWSAWPISAASASLMAVSANGLDLSRLGRAFGVGAFGHVGVGRRLPGRVGVVVLAVVASRRVGWLEHPAVDGADDHDAAHQA